MVQQLSSNSPSVVSLYLSPFLAALSTMPTGVLVGSTFSSALRAIARFIGRCEEDGLYIAIVKPADAAAISRFSMTSHGVSRSDRLI